MKSKWKAHLKTKESTEAFDNAWVNSRIVRERLCDIIDEMLDDLEDTQIDPDNYALAQWGLHQADCIAQRRTLKKIKEFIKDDKKT
jgi:hypothetical protein